MRTLRLPLLLIVVGATLGCVQTLRPYRSQPGGRVDSPRLAALTVRVVGDDRHDVDQATTILERAGVFASVTTAPDAPADLLARAGHVPHPIVCGTEELSFHFRTLGLGLFRSAFHDFLRIEFLSPDGDVALTLQQAAPVDSRTGIWALPMRMSRNWRRPDPVDPTNLAAEFRDVLVSREPELVTLARRSG